MVLTRLDTDVVEKGVEDALQVLELMAEIVEPILRRLTARQREQAPKPPLRFDDAARAMVAAVEKEAPGLARQCEFDKAAVLEDLDNAKTLVPLIARLESLLRLAEDTRLAWRAEAYNGTMPVYRMAKAGVGTDPKLEPIVRPFDEVFSRPKGDPGDSAA